LRLKKPGARKSNYKSALTYGWIIRRRNGISRYFVLKKNSIRHFYYSQIDGFENDVA
jgi:hypothetical protein